MKAWVSLATAISILCVAGCMSDRTKGMTEACQGLLEQGERQDAGTFIRDAEAHISSLDKPRNKASAYLLDLQDPDAGVYRPALEQCLWRLKSRLQ